MFHVSHVRSLLLFLSMVAAIVGPDKGATLRAAQEPSSDETLLRAAVSHYFESFAKKDQDDPLKYWSAGAPELQSRRNEFQHDFAANDGITVRNLAIRKLKIEGDKAALQVAVEITASDIKTGRPSTAFGKMVRAMQWVKESGVWKVTHEASAEDELAASLIAARTDEERASIVGTNGELLNPVLIRALVAQGNRLRIQGKLSESLRIYQIALGQAERIGDRAGTAVTFRAAGTAKRMQGDYDAALDYYRQSLAMNEASGDKLSTATALNSIAGVEYIRGQYTKALETYARSLKINEELNNSEGVGSVLNNMGLVFLDQGNYLKSLDSFQKSLAFTDPSDGLGIASTLLNIGYLYSTLGNYPLALDYLQQALARAEELGAKPVIWKALQGIGTVQRSQGNFAQSLDYLEKALSILTSLGSKDRITEILTEIGAVYYEQGDYARALEFFQKSLDIAQTIGVKTAATLNAMARTYNAQGDHARALDFAERAADVARETDQNEVLWQARTTSGEAFLALRQSEKARQAFTEAIRIIDSLREEVPGAETQREEFFENKLAPYKAMIKLLLAENNPAAALANAERAKGRVLLDVLRSGRTNINKAMSSSERQREQELTGTLIGLNTQIAREKMRDKPDSARVGDLNTQIEKARLKREDFQTSLYAAHPELKIQRGETEAWRLEQATELLPDNKSALLEYVVAADRLYLFVITRGTRNDDAGLQTYTIPLKRDELGAQVEKFWRRLANHDLDYRDSAAELYDLVIKAAQGQLQGKNTLIIVPDDVLWDLPFQALKPAGGHYLVEDYAISYAPSLTVLRAMIAKRRQTKTAMATLLAVGNPSLAKLTVERARNVLSEALDSLPEAERQVKTLGQLYGPAQSRIYFGSEAREGRVKAEAANYRILQLATHGVLNNANPMYSHIVLSQSADDPKEDGLLEAWEIMDLDLKAELVVLSACDTARGRIGAGEGVIGLTWAFFVAGSPTTVVSQWSVESASTTELMLNFHRNLKAPRGGSQYAMTKAEALRQAQLKLLRTKQYQHPFFWAGFVVVGDGF
ncbi:MAG TPA: CHAT domain-containing tetratricopeptide repeat protein [Pyrinomonadaceae bacterium]